ncbi:hypothetical protein T484DRAFT_1803156 [Baffinella frigidus]|nr:hypothetical protein T484DRAFT_1803156 [Cryptophyta sp. CCMP2293]
MQRLPVLFAAALLLAGASAADTYTSAGHTLQVCALATDSITVDVVNKNSALTTASSTAFAWAGASGSSFAPSTAMDAAGKHFAVAGHGTSGAKVLVYDYAGAAVTKTAECGLPASLDEVDAYGNSTTFATESDAKIECIVYSESTLYVLYHAYTNGSGLLLASLDLTSCAFTYVLTPPAAVDVTSTGGRATCAAVDSKKKVPTSNP